MQDARCITLRIFSAIHLREEIKMILKREVSVSPRSPRAESYALERKTLFFSNPQSTQHRIHGSKPSPSYVRPHKKA